MTKDNQSWGFDFSIAGVQLNPHCFQYDESTITCRCNKVVTLRFYKHPDKIILDAWICLFSFRPIYIYNEVFTHETTDKYSQKYLEHIFSYPDILRLYRDVEERVIPFTPEPYMHWYDGIQREISLNSLLTPTDRTMLSNAIDNLPEFTWSWHDERVIAHNRTIEQENHLNIQAMLSCTEREIE